MRCLPWVDGLAKVVEAPNLAGQNERYLIEQLGNFQTGVRQNEMMSIVIKDLSLTDIDDLAAYYAAIQIAVERSRATDWVPRNRHTPSPGALPAPWSLQ